MKNSPILTFIILAIFIITVYLFESSKSKTILNTEKPINIEAQKVITQDMPFILQLTGTNEASENVSVTSQVTGQIIAVNFVQGQNVKKGDILFQIDKRPFEYQLEQAQANLHRDEALLINAQKEEKRYYNLLKEKAVSEEQYQQMLANLNSLKATIEADKAAIDNAKLQIEYSNITAPIDGKTGELLIDIGNLIQANSPNPLVTIRKFSPIYVNFSAPEQFLPGILKSYANNELEVSIKTSLNEIIKDGQIIFIDNQVDQPTSTIKLKASFDNKDELLWPGQPTKLSLKIFVRKNAITIPTKAVQINQNGPFVFVINDENRTEIRKIKIDFSDDTIIVVSEGLKENEVIVTNGQLKLSNKTLVSYKS